MDKKTIKIIIIGIICFAVILIANYIYNQNNYFSRWLICVYEPENSNYKEELKFNFVQNVMYEYEREEYMGATKEDSLDDIFDFFLEQKSKINNKLNDDFKYNIEIVDNKVHVHTYIKTLSKIDFFNEYLKSKNIGFNSTIEEIEKSLGDEYTCHIKKV